MLVDVEPAIEQIETLKTFLPEKTKEELAQILEFGEKMKAEGEKKEKEFWNEWSINSSLHKKFKNLLIQYEESKEKFIKSLTPDERKMLDNLDGLSKDKFYNEYLYKRIIYSGEINDKDYGGSIEYKNENGKFDLERFKNWLNNCKYSLKPGMTIYLSEKKLGYEGVKILAESWKYSLKPGMTICLEGNNIGYEGAKILAETWKDKLQPGMTIYLSENKLGYEGVKILAESWKYSLKPGISIWLNDNDIGDKLAKILAETWKDKLQPGMIINLCNNDLGYEGVKILAETWKNKLQPGIKIDLRENNLGDEGVKIIMQNLELKEGVILDLRYNEEISDEMKKELEKWKQGYKDQGIYCKVLV